LGVSKELQIKVNLYVFAGSNSHNLGYKFVGNCPYSGNKIKFTENAAILLNDLSIPAMVDCHSFNIFFRGELIYLISASFTG